MSRKTARRRRIITCGCGCGRQAPHEAYGYISACYRRWLLAGRPDAGPPLPRIPDHRPGKATQARLKAARLAAYAGHRDAGKSIQLAAAEMRLSERTAWRYEAELKQQRKAMAS